MSRALIMRHNVDGLYCAPIALAETINMATNSFARFFKNNMGITVQNFVMKRRM